MNAQVKREYSDKEIEELAEWLEGLKIEQIFFLRDQMNIICELLKEDVESQYVH